MDIIIKPDDGVFSVGDMYHKWNTSKCDSSIVQLNIKRVVHEYPAGPGSPRSSSNVFIARSHDALLGMATLFPRKYEHMNIAGVGQVAVRPAVRGQGVATELMLYLIGKMHRDRYDISVLWASVLKVYECVGYKAYYRNMMCLPVMKQIEPWMLLNLKEIPERIGAW